MAAIIKLKLDLNKIDKSKIFEGTKGKYYEIDVMINDKFDNYGQNVSACNPTASKDETKVYIGNGKIVWTNNEPLQVAPKQGQPQQAQSDEPPF